MNQPETPVPVLAGLAGSYREAAPPPALAAHFQCAWSHVIAADHVGPIAVVPDGCVDLEWRDGRLIVAGPDVTAALPPVKSGTAIVGMRFQPGAATRWLGLPMSQIVGLEVDLAEIWGERARDIADRLAEKRTVEEQAYLFHSLLAQMSGEIEPATSEAVTIFNVAGQGSNEDSAIPLLRDRLELSERTLRRRSQDYFGYGTKTLGRILRFQKFMQAAQADPGSGLASLAYEAGYADQPHLSREIQALCGMTALTVLRQLRP